MGCISLETLIADIPKASYLNKMLDKTTSSYKFYWVKGILDSVVSGKNELTFSYLVSRMIAAAWYPVLFSRLSLGATDQLGEIIEYLFQAYDLPRAANEDELADMVYDCIKTDKKLAAMAKNLTKYVPYRAIRPFYEEQVVRAQNKLKEQGVKRVDAKADAIIIEQHRQDPARAMYSINEEEKSLIVADDWGEFIKKNQAIIFGWFDARLTSYLQARNPSVPAISMKLRPPVQRDLAGPTRYWRYAISLIEVKDIYLNKPFSDESFKRYGGLSIDHFVPWSFVLHDELWNLVPTFKNVNSSKSDHLPDLNTYFANFCSVQFDAFIAIKDSNAAKQFSKQMDSYRSIDSRIDQYVNSDTSRRLFEQSIKNTVLPLYQIALNQGYVEWIASG